MYVQVCIYTFTEMHIHDVRKYMYIYVCIYIYVLLTILFSMLTIDYLLITHAHAMGQATHGTQEPEANPKETAGTGPGLGALSSLGPRLVLMARMGHPWYAWPWPMSRA